MELFDPAKPVRLRSHHGKYLKASDDEKHVVQDNDGSTLAAYWTVELVDNFPDVLRLRSAYGSYLTASDEAFLLGVTGKKVLQTLPARIDSSLEWEPVREGVQVKLKTRYGHYLRANGGPPPWRNSVTHDVAHHTAFRDWILWDVENYEAQPQHQMPAPTVAPLPNRHHSRHSSSEVETESVSYHVSTYSTSPSLSKSESSSSFSGPIPKVEGRSIFYAVADDDGVVDDSIEWPHLTFVGTSLEELAELLREETGLDEIFLCTRNPLNNQLIRLALQLPPNNHDIRLVVVEANSSGFGIFDAVNAQKEELANPSNGRLMRGLCSKGGVS